MKKYNKMQPQITTTNFKKLNFNLKIIIFSYLNTYDRIIVYYLNSNLRKLLPDSPLKFNKNNLKVLALALSLKTKNNYLVEDYYINYLYEYNIIPIIIRNFIEVKNLKSEEDDIIVGLANYFNICREKFKENEIRLNFLDDDLSVMVELTRLLDKEKFVYALEYNDYLFDIFTEARKINSLLNNLKFVKNLNLDKKNIYQIEDLKHLSLNEKINFLSKPYKFMEYKNCFISHHLDLYNTEEVNPIEVFEKLNDKISGLICLGDDINLTKNKNISKDEHEEIFKKKIPDGLKNLNSFFDLSSISKVNTNSLIFKNIKVLKNLIIMPEHKQVITNFLNDHPEIEELKIIIEGKFNFTNLFLPNLKKLKISAEFRFYNYNTLVNFPKLDCFYITDSSRHELEEEKFIKIKGLFSYATKLGFTVEDYNFVTFLIKNKFKNNSQIKNCYIKSNDVEEIIKFINFIYVCQFEKLIEKIQSIVLTKNDSKDELSDSIIIKNLFSNLRCIKIPSENYLPLLLYTKTLDKLEIAEIKKYDPRKFNYTIGKKISDFFIKKDIMKPEETFLKFIAENMKKFNQLKILNISGGSEHGYSISEFTYYDVTKFNSIFNRLSKMKLAFFNIHVISESKSQAADALFKKLKVIPGVREFSYVDNVPLYLNYCDDSFDSDYHDRHIFDRYNYNIMEDIYDDMYESMYGDMHEGMYDAMYDAMYDGMYDHDF
jgi:hypothetical protein